MQVSSAVVYLRAALFRNTTNYEAMAFQGCYFILCVCACVLRHERQGIFKEQSGVHMKPYNKFYSIEINGMEVFFISNVCNFFPHVTKI